MLGTTAEQAIWTPDRRLRVFVSSTLGELGAERAAVRQAIERLRLSPIMFELGARPHPPRALYRSYLAQSDVFLGIYWQRYGWVAPDMSISGLEDEFILSAGMPRLIYCKRPAPDMEPQLATLLAQLQDGDSVSYRPFKTADELHELVLDDLALMLTERFGASVATGPAGGAAVPLPEPTTEILGRDGDVEDVSSLLTRGHRLVTLSGLGGVGKTRLAVAVAKRIRDQGDREVAFVDLSPVTAPDAVIPRIAAATGAREEGTEETIDALVRRVSDRPWLLVLDNFEQVVTAAPQLATLLERAPELQLLVTSRVLLRLRGELEHAVRPLAVHGAEESSPAVALFEQRARAARQEFAVDGANVGVVSELCRRLDGLPLALELVAPQLRLFTPGQLLARLDDWLQGDAMQLAYADLPQRQRTLRATLDWSWELLSEPARVVFARLSVFAASFTVEAATEVCAGDDVDVAGAMAELLDHSLLSEAARSDRQPAFRMLDTVRMQARARLGEGPEADRTLSALEGHLVNQLTSASARLHSADQTLAVRQLNDYVGDMAAVLDWLLRSRRPLGPLLGGIASCWVWAQITGELRRLPDFAHLIDASGNGPDQERPDQERPDQERAVVCWMHMGRLMTACRFEEVAPFVNEHYALLSQLEPAAHGMALVVRGLATAQDAATVATQGLGLLETAVAMLRDADYPPGVGYGLSHLGDARLIADDRGGAQAAYEEALSIGRATGELNLAAEATYHLAILSLELGDSREATDHLRVAARYYIELDHQDGISRCLAVLAGIRVAAGDLTDAARIFRVVDAIRDPLGLRPWPMVMLMEQRWRDQTPARSDEPASGTDQARGSEPDGASELARSLGL